MNCKIGLIHGDGIGPEIVNEAKKVLDAAASRYGHDFSYTELLLGGASIDVHGVPLTEETVEQARACDAVLMGSIGGDALLRGISWSRRSARRPAFWGSARR